ncbi:MAG: aspartate-semialdehyde dehydrogenase [Bauldia sp.]
MAGPHISIVGFGLTTANILYRLPDHPGLLQSFVWQHYDLAPAFPGLQRFLDFWRREIDGPVHSVSVAHRLLIGANDVRAVRAEFALH